MAKSLRTTQVRAVVKHEEIHHGTLTRMADDNGVIRGIDFYGCTLTRSVGRRKFAHCTFTHCTWSNDRTGFAWSANRLTEAVALIK